MFTVDTVFVNTNNYVEPDRIKSERFQLKTNLEQAPCGLTSGDEEPIQVRPEYDHPMKENSYF